MRWLAAWVLAGGILPAGGAEDEVARAFAAVSRGDADAVSGLVGLGPATIPAVARFTRDPEERVRRAALGVLNGIGGPGVCEPFVRALADASQDLRDRAALGAWRHCDREQLRRIPGAGALLARATAADHGTVAGILLLGYFPGEAGRAALERLDREALGKIEPWDAPVRQAVACDTALLLLGVPEARQRLKDALSDPAAAVFLLRASRDIQDREVLGALAALLDDERRSPAVGAEGEPPLRVCDVAVRSLAARFDWRPPFLLEIRRYDAREREILAGFIRERLAAP